MVHAASAPRITILARLEGEREPYCSLRESCLRLACASNAAQMGKPALKYSDELTSSGLSSFRAPSMLASGAWAAGGHQRDTASARADAQH